MSRRFRPNSAGFSLNRADLDRFRADFNHTLAGVGRCSARPTPAEFRADLGRSWAAFCEPISTKFGGSRPIPGQPSTIIGHFRPALDRVRSHLHRFWPTLGEFGQSWAVLDQNCTESGEIHRARRVRTEVWQLWIGSGTPKTCAVCCSAGVPTSYSRSAPSRWAKFHRIRARLGRTCPNSADAGPASADSGPNLVELGSTEVGPKLADAGPQVGDLRQARPRSGRSCAKFGRRLCQIWPIPSNAWSIPGSMSPGLAEIGRFWRDLDQLRQVSGQSRPTSACVRGESTRFGPRVGFGLLSMKLQGFLFLNAHGAVCCTTRYV